MLGGYSVSEEFIVFRRFLFSFYLFSYLINVECVVVVCRFCVGDLGYSRDEIYKFFFFCGMGVLVVEMDGEC